MAGFFSPHHGEGAVSTGLMVPVHDAKSVVEARTIVELLEKHHIPALVNLEVDGILFPWKDPPKNSAARVLVPSQMLPTAREVLKRAGREGVKPQASFGLRIGAADAFSPGRERVELRGVRAIPAPADTLIEDDEEDTGPIDLVLPEPSPLNQRMLFALMAIAAGMTFQRLVELAFGQSGAIERYAAKAPIWSEVYRLVTAGFLHNGPEHFLANALFATVLGVVLLGTHHFGATALVWLLSSTTGLATEATLTPEAVLIAGASAGNYGLVGLWANGQLDRARRSLLPKREKMRTLGILLILLPGALTPISSTGSKVAVLAHLGGFLGGFLLGFVFKRRLIDRELPMIAQRSRIAFGVAAAIVVSTMSFVLYQALR